MEEAHDEVGLPLKATWTSEQTEEGVVKRLGHWVLWPPGFSLEPSQKEKNFEMMLLTEKLNFFIYNIIILIVYALTN